MNKFDNEYVDTIIAGVISPTVCTSRDVVEDHPPASVEIDSELVRTAVVDN